MTVERMNVAECNKQ